MEKYWLKTSDETIKLLFSSRDGLTEEEAAKRLKKYGLNDIPKRKEKSAIFLFLSQFKNPLILALIAASLISIFTGGFYEAIIIVTIIFLNCSVGFFQEYKSEKDLQKLCKYIKYTAKVLRDGKVTEVDTRKIVPGDIVCLETGDRVPADLRLIEAEELEIDESIITGESFPSSKFTSPIKQEKLEPQKMANMALMGTLVVNGKGKGVVVATGMQSMFGKIVGYLKSEEPQTYFQKNVRILSNFLIKLVLIGTIFIFIINSITGKKIFDSLIFSLALAVGIIPEALPIIITVGLSGGAIRMSKKGVIVKKLISIEDLGDMDVLCVDKTGTLTENKVSLTDFCDIEGRRNEEIIELASYCISIVEKGKGVSGNPIDVAIHEYTKRKNLKRNYEVIDQIPFDYYRRRMSVVLKRDNKFLLVCKGSPESIASICTRMKKHDGILEVDKKKIEEKFKELSEEGLRVLAVAYKTIEKKKDYTEKDEKDLVFLGFLCFIDPPKLTAKDSLMKLKELGIEIKILTGDYALVAKRIAETLGIEIKGIVSGEEIENASEKKLEELVEKANIFARLTPDQKVKIVSVLRKRHVVGFLGDGVNDAPALKISDVGISVENGADVAKEAADIILTKKSLRIISEGVIEGRKTFANTGKYIMNTVSANLGNVTTLALISPFLNFLPLLPSQILLTNLLTDGPLLSISRDRVDEDELKKPKRWNIKFLRNFSLFFGGISSFFDFLTIGLILFLLQATILGFSIYLPENKQAIFRTCWFLESSLSEIFITFAIRTKKRFYKSRPSTTLTLLSLIFSLLILLITFSPIGSIFELIQLDSFFFFLMFLILLTYFLIAEILKAIFYKKFAF